jgi:hypothetical protein
LGAKWLFLFPPAEEEKKTAESGHISQNCNFFLKTLGRVWISEKNPLQ